MINFRQTLAIMAGGLAFLGIILPLGDVGGTPQSIWDDNGLIVFAIVGVLTTITIVLNKIKGLLSDVIMVVLPHVGAWYLLSRLDIPEQQLSSGYWCLVISAWLMAWLLVDQLSAKTSRSISVKRVYNIVVPVLFGVWLLILWETVVRGLNVPTVLLPPPSMIGVRFMASTSILWADFQQTFLKAVLIGYVLGCGSAFITAILIDRSPFLQRGLLPIGNLVSALPIIGVAPIMVMWFGFDWQSKAAVVIIMTFFPMLVNTVAGLSITSSIEKDMMKTYAASYWQSLFKLRLPSALPFIFNALKINSTLAMIGAIVAEFFGTPIVGMGFRISTEVGRMNVDMVWAEIAVAALAGTAFYGIMVVIERACTFWHPSFRSEN
ncbi:ABC transporter permease [Kiloniella antarctica]|uniref:ABC transporter permease n=1 Tax=Kiloniella antarctica TaxID=1550907 RepID=A0ABW5BIN0_9PROT